MTETGEARSLPLQDIIPASAASGTRSADAGTGNHAAAAEPNSSSDEEAEELSFQQLVQHSALVARHHCRACQIIIVASGLKLSRDTLKVLVGVSCSNMTEPNEGVKAGISRA